MAFEDKEIICKGTNDGPCGKKFIWSQAGQEYFQEKGFSAPVRCKDCRLKAKQQRAGK
jgi:hypothetical protein